jgi:hypothetical protein
MKAALIILQLVANGGLWSASCRGHFIPRGKSSRYQLIIIIIIITHLLTAIDFTLGGTSPYTSTDKTSKNKYT